MSLEAPISNPGKRLAFDVAAKIALEPPKKRQNRMPRACAPTEYNSYPNLQQLITSHHLDIFGPLCDIRDATEWDQTLN
jgi:hypothetical protein